MDSFVGEALVWRSNVRVCMDRLLLLVLPVFSHLDTRVFDKETEEDVVFHDEDWVTVGN